jgi:hypothetical protein
MIAVVCTVYWYEVTLFVNCTNCTRLVLFISMFYLNVQLGAFFALGKYKIKRCKVTKHEIVVENNRPWTTCLCQCSCSVSVLSMAILLVHTKGWEIEEAPIPVPKTRLVWVLTLKTVFQQRLCSWSRMELLRFHSSLPWGSLVSLSLMLIHLPPCMIKWVFFCVFFLGWGGLQNNILLERSCRRVFLA